MHKIKTQANKAKHHGSNKETYSKTLGGATTIHVDIQSY
jgi:hypothetical protein